MSFARRGLFVVFEGVEKCGKKTQADLLADALTQITGKKALHIHFPDKTTQIGKLLDLYAKGELDLNPQAAHLLYTANRWERAEEILNALNSGISVVVDRYSYSGIVNTAAKINPLSEADWKWCRATESGLPQPDVIFCLVPECFDEIFVRDGFGSKRFETADFQKKVLYNYSRLSHEMETELADGSEGFPGDGTTTKIEKPKLWNWLEATGQTVDDIHACVMAILDPKL